MDRNTSDILLSSRAEAHDDKLPPSLILVGNEKPAQYQEFLRAMPCALRLLS